MNPNPDRLFERLLDDPLTRRRLLQRGGAGALSMSALAYLAACGETGGTAGGGSGKVEQVKKGEVADSMYFANWPLYIDVDEKTKQRGTLVDFEKKYGTKTKYVEEINDNTEFFGKVRQQYARGDSGGRDIHVVTDWMAARMKRLGYVQKLDHAALPNVDANLIERLKHAAVRSQARLLGAVAVGPDGDHLPQGQGQAHAQEHQRPVRPGLQGQGHDADRDARLGRPDDARHGLRSGEGRHRQGARGDRQDRQGVRVGSDPRLHRQRVHEGHHARATRG